MRIVSGVVRGASHSARPGVDLPPEGKKKLRWFDYYSSVVKMPV
jgi:hypothetical protein